MTNLIERAAQHPGARRYAQDKFRGFDRGEREQFSTDWDALARDGQTICDQQLGHE